MHHVHSMLRERWQQPTYSAHLNPLHHHSQRAFAYEMFSTRSFRAAPAMVMKDVKRNFCEGGFHEKFGEERLRKYECESALYDFYHRYARVYNDDIQDLRNRM